MGVHRNIDANFLRGVMPKVPSKKHPYENFGMPYVFLWILQPIDARASFVSRIKAPPLRVDFVEERQQTMIWEQPFRVEPG